MPVASSVVSTPTAVELPAKVKQVAAHWYGVCALLENDAVWCGRTPPKPFVLVEANPVASVAVTVAGPCVIRLNGTLWCGSWATTPGEPCADDQSRH